MTTERQRPKHLPPAATALWDWIEKRGLTQRQVAKLLDMRHVNLNRFLHNRRRPGLAAATQIESLTGIKAALWLEPYVGKSRKLGTAPRVKPSTFHSGNANA